MLAALKLIKTLFLAKVNVLSAAHVKPHDWTLYMERKASYETTGTYRQDRLNVTECSRGANPPSMASYN